MKNLLDGFAPSLYGARVAISYFVDDIETDNVDRFMTRLRSILGSIPYRSVSNEKLYERDFQVAIYLTFSLIGEFIEIEVLNAVGRADAVVRTLNTIYILEFKLWCTGRPSETLTQIKNKGYAPSYLSYGKRVILISASFDETKRNIGT